MAQFIFILIGRQKLAEMPADQSAATLASWEQWGQSLGAALVSKGLPFAEGNEVVDMDAQAPPQSMCGYHIVQANDLAQATTLSQSHPFLSGRQGNSIVIYELMTEPRASYVQNPPVNQSATQSAAPTIEKTPQALPPLPGQEVAPTQNTGELTISHEAEDASETISSDLPPTPPAQPGA